MSKHAAGGRTRREKDMLGSVRISDEHYYGVHTARALENFPISRYKLHDFPEFIVALVRIKEAAAWANHSLRLLSRPISTAIGKACRRIVAEGLWSQFPIDMMQGGGGTSVNMNANEVIANLAGESMGDGKGNYAKVHPLAHVNLGQSTNDVYPSAIRVALHGKAVSLAAPLKGVCETLAAKAKAFAPVTKLGRTCLQDAVPMTLGQEFSGYRDLVRRTAAALGKEAGSLRMLNLGGTAVGTGICGHKDFGPLAVQRLNRTTGGDFRVARNLFDATQNCDAMLAVSGRLKTLALALSKIANDLRLLSSGPEAGLAEIALPAVQAGSSIMPAKVNPVIPELVNQVAYRICGNDTTISMALERGELELNIMEPVMVLCLLESMEILGNAARQFDVKCLQGIEANASVCRRYASAATSVYTLLSGRLGYHAVGELVKQSQATGTDIRRLILEQGLLTPKELADCLKPIA